MAHGQDNSGEKTHDSQAGQNESEKEESFFRPSGDEKEDQSEGPSSEKVEEKKQEEDFRTRCLYLVAEIDNMQKRFAREKESLVKFGNERLLGDLIEVIDNLERTISAIGQDQDPKVKNIVTGIEMIKNQFIDVLGRFGLSPIKSVGEEFDPNLHEAVSQKSIENKKEHEILEEFQKGYMLNGRLLRASKVIICSH